MARKPKAKSKVRHTKSVTVRMDADIRAKVQEWANDRGVTFTRALETLTRIGLEDRNRAGKEIIRNFGGLHNLALALLVARIATGIEHMREKSWKGDPVGLFYVLLATCAVLREFLPNGWPKLFTVSLLTEGHKPAGRWDKVVSKVRDNLNNPDHTWWPLSDGGADESVVPIRKLVKLLASMPRRKDLAAKLDPKFDRLIRMREESNLHYRFIM